MKNLIIILLLALLINPFSNNGQSPKHPIYKNTSKKFIKLPKVKAPIKETDTVYVYFKGTKKVSTKVSNWKDSRRELLIYDFTTQQVNLTLKDVRMSYTIFSDIKYRSDNSVEKILISENPGASMYMYSSTITCNNQNVPEWKTNNTFPPKDLIEASGDSYYWDIKNKQWIKQEVSKDNIAPVKTNK